VDYLQQTLGVQLALENIALTFDPGGEIGTMAFIREVSRRTGCGVHLDITNMTINAVNGFCDDDEELAALDPSTVLSVHLAGGARDDGMMRDCHSFPVSDADLARLRELLPEMPNCRTVVVERDGRLSEVEEVTGDLARSRAAVSDVERTVPRSRVSDTLS
jgi:uncharacterized protein (UPF0276 family)